jgi:hypothetical protein
LYFRHISTVERPTDREGGIEVVLVIRLDEAHSIIPFPASLPSEGVSGCWSEYKRNSAIGIGSVCSEGDAVYSAENLVVFVGNAGLREILGNLDNYISHLSQLNLQDVSGILFHIPCQLQNVNDN